MPDILDLFDLDSPADQKALVKAVKREERQAQRAEERERGAALAALRASMLEPAPESLVGIELVVELQRCERCGEQTEHVCSNGVMLKYHQPEKRLARFGGERNYQVNPELTTWRKGPLPVNWQEYPRGFKYIETTTPICSECWERNGMIGLEDSCTSFDEHMEGTCSCSR